MNTAPTSELVVEKGSAYIFYAFDVGHSIDTVKAEQLLSAGRPKPLNLEKKRPTKYFEFTPPPVRWTEDAPSVDLGPGFQSLGRADMLLFDFGCVSVRFEVPLQGPASKIIDLSVDLYENTKLMDAARGLVEKLLKKMELAVEKLHIAPRVEDYCIFHFSKMRPEMSVKELLDLHILPLACILRAEKSAPSDREIQEFLNDRISYGKNDFTMMSWHGAVIYSEEAEDIYAVLEFTNSVLMELSYLDTTLDRSLDGFYDYFTKNKRKHIFGFRSKAMMQRISQLQIESAVLFERITNAIKLMGDDFQAKIFQLASKKMGLAAWDASIAKKLQTLESLYGKVSDSEGARRMELLEVIIIILILISIFVSHPPG